MLPDNEGQVPYFFPLPTGAAGASWWQHGRPPPGPPHQAYHLPSAASYQKSHDVASLYSDDVSRRTSCFPGGIFHCVSDLTADPTQQPPPPPDLTPPPSTASGAPSLSSVSATSPTLPSVNYSRGPSPLRGSSISCSESLTVKSIGTPPDGEEEETDNSFICLGPRCDAVFASEADLETHVRDVHTHTCNWTGCGRGSFPTKEELVGHVKAEHLGLDPATRLSESVSSGKKTENQPKVSNAALGKRKSDHAPDFRRRPKARRAAEGEQASLVEDKALSEYLSANACKRRCSAQLRLVFEKRAKRAVGTPRAANSPGGESQALLNSTPFPLVWEHGVLPFLIQFIPKWCGPGHVISITRRPMSAASSSRSKPGRLINIVTRAEVSRARRVTIASHVRDLLPESYRQSTSFCFAVGQVSRSVWARGLSRAMPDEVCAPRNPFHFKNPCMGDSIGIDDTDETEEATATLGPCLLIHGGPFWLTNLHPFSDAVDAIEEASRIVQHPSPADRELCQDEDHDALSNLKTEHFRLGRLTAWSGFDLKTTRLSHDPYWEEMDVDPPMIVIDWCLISSSSRTANICRQFPQENNPLSKGPIVRSVAGRVSPGSTVIVSSRTSGYQRGVVCEVPAYLDGDQNSNGTGTATREWFIEELSGDCDAEDWIRGGIGVPGDSGAAVIDASTNGLVGQLWARNKYWGPGPRMAFFTPMSDVFDDVQERCRLTARPSLPQYRDEADRYPTYPSCRQCYDLAAYLDSRRSSRESLVSMIPGPAHRRGGVCGAGGCGESESEDVTTVAPSELATPKDQGYWLRHVGQEDAAITSAPDGAAAANPASFAAYEMTDPGSPVVLSGHGSYFSPSFGVVDYGGNGPAGSGSGSIRRRSIRRGLKESPFYPLECKRFTCDDDIDDDHLDVPGSPVGKRVPVGLLRSEGRNDPKRLKFEG